MQNPIGNDGRYEAVEYIRKGRGNDMSGRDEMNAFVDEEGGNSNRSIRRKRYFLITTFLIIAIVAILLCMSYFTKSKVNEYDGTLVYEPEEITNIAEG